MLMDAISPFVNRPILENFLMQKEKKKKRTIDFLDRFLYSS